MAFFLILFWFCAAFHFRFCHFTQIFTFFFVPPGIATLLQMIDCLQFSSISTILASPRIVFAPVIQICWLIHFWFMPPSMCTPNATSHHSSHFPPPPPLPQFILSGINPHPSVHLRAPSLHVTYLTFSDKISPLPSPIKTENEFFTHWCGGAANFYHCRPQNITSHHQLAANDDDREHGGHVRVRTFFVCGGIYGNVPRLIGELKLGGGGATKLAEQQHQKIGGKMRDVPLLHSICSSRRDVLTVRLAVICECIIFWFAHTISHYFHYRTTAALGWFDSLWFFFRTVIFCCCCCCGWLGKLRRCRRCIQSIHTQTSSNPSNPSIHSIIITHNIIIFLVVFNSIEQNPLF